jgi:3-deoxy-D-manno-octulosonic-acid transferase
MHFVYQACIHAYTLLLHLASIFHNKAKLWIHGRKNWKEILAEKRNPADKWIWFHCSSLGEYEDCCEVFHELIKMNPSKKTLLTFFSPSGYEHKKNSSLYTLVMYLPTDTKKNASSFLDILRPGSVFFSRSDLWFNFLNETRKLNIPVFLLSVRLSKTSGFLGWPVRSFYKKCLNCFTHIYCQDQVTRDLLKEKFDISFTSVTGNTRFDRVHASAFPGKEFPELDEFIKDSFVIVAGSCLPKDENILLKALGQLGSHHVKCIIVPHEINDKDIERSIQKCQGKALRYSRINSLSGAQSILYFDTIGDLKYLYRLANLALVGGGFDRIGIHNVLEPAVFGVNIAFGPHHRNYPEALELLRTGTANIYRNAAELSSIIRTQMDHPEDAASGPEFENYMNSHLGASSRITRLIQQSYPGLIQARETRFMQGNQFSQ